MFGSLALLGATDQAAPRRPIQSRNVVHGNVASGFVYDFATATVDGVTLALTFSPRSAALPLIANHKWLRTVV